MPRNGRTPNISAEIVRQIVDFARLGLPEVWIGPALDPPLDRSIISKWKARGEKEKKGLYFDLFNGIRAAKPKAIASNLLYISDARPRDWRAAKAMLEILDPARFAKKVVLAGDPDNPTPIPTATIVMSEAERARVLESARRVRDAVGEDE